MSGALRRDDGKIRTTYSAWEKVEAGFQGKTGDSPPEYVASSLPPEVDIHRLDCALTTYVLLRLYRLLDQERRYATGAVLHRHDARARPAAGAHFGDVDAGGQEARARHIDVGDAPADAVEPVGP